MAITQLERLKIHLDINSSEEDDLLNDILESSKNAILARRFPYCEYPVDEGGNTQIESRYLDLQIRIAIYLYNKRGAEGQTVHNENGINRTFESADIPESIMRVVTPYVGVL